MRTEQAGILGAIQSGLKTAQKFVNKTVKPGINAVTNPAGPKAPPAYKPPKQPKQTRPPKPPKLPKAPKPVVPTPESAMLMLETAAADQYARLTPHERMVYEHAHPRSRYIR